MGYLTQNLKFNPTHDFTLHFCMVHFTNIPPDTPSSTAEKLSLYQFVVPRCVYYTTTIIDLIILKRHAMRKNF